MARKQVRRLTKTLVQNDGVLRRLSDERRRMERDMGETARDIDAIDREISALEEELRRVCGRRSPS